MSTVAVQTPVAAHGGKYVDMGTIDSPPRNIKSSINYISHDISTEKWNAGDTLGHPADWGMFNENVPVEVNDVRGREKELSLEANGFFFYPDPLEMKPDDWKSNDTIISKYYPALEKLLFKTCPGAIRVKIFNHIVREGSSVNEKPVYTQHDPNNPVPHQQAYRCHVDQDMAAARKMVEDLLPDDANQLLGRRFQIVNVWRPLKTCYRDPLAIADTRTVKPEDIVQMRTSQKDGSWVTVLGVKPNPSHGWWYKSEMSPDDAMVFKQWDSGVGQPRHGQVPHCAVPDNDWPEEKLYPRASIEARALVFYDEDCVDMDAIKDAA